MKEPHLIEKFWYPSSKFRSFIYFIFWLPSLPFLLLVKLKYFLYANKLLKSNAFSKPVLVVGNISVGGTGKTPFIRSLVKLLKKQNINAGIVSRGYLSNLDNYPHQVSNNDSAYDVGDEAFMQFNNLQIPIVIDGDRSRAVNYLINNNSVDIIISDDGLQHYKMQRDYEVVLLDSTRSFGNQLIIPFGPLREPVSRIKDINLLIKNGTTKTTSAIEKAVNEEVIIIPKQFVNIKTKESFELQNFINISVNALAGIGNPNRFFATLNGLCNLRETFVFPDHHNFSKDDFSFNKHSKNDQMPLIMTEKDAVKCQEFAQDNWYYLEVEMSFSKSLSNNLKSNIKKIIERNKNG